MQQGKDSEGNYQFFEFILDENARERCRVVRPVKEWWMADHYKSSHWGDLLGGMVEETYYEWVQHFQSW